MTNDAGDVETMLVVRSRGGERAAFEELVRHTARALFARLYVDTADAHRAEDLVQETYLRAWKKIASLEDARTFRGWLYAVAQTVLLDSVKAENRRKRRWWKSKAVRQEEAIARLVDQRPTPDESSERLDEQKRMLAILKELPPEYRDVLTLRYLSGADYQTIGKQLAISNGSLRGLLSRGMKMLRERIGDVSDEEE